MLPCVLDEKHRLKLQPAPSPAVARSLRLPHTCPFPQDSLEVTANGHSGGPTLTPAKIPVVDTLKSRYASTSGEGGLKMLATFFFGMSSVNRRSQWLMLHSLQR